MSESNREIFKSVVKFKNFLTNDLIEFHKVGNFIVEESHGVGMLGNPVMGFTVVQIVPRKHRTDLGQMINEDTRGENRSKFELLKRSLKNEPRV